MWYVVKDLTLLSIFLVSTGCMLDATITGTGKPSSVESPQYLTTIENVPFKASNVTALNVKISGSDVVAYKYKIGGASATDCADPAGYSASEVSVVSPIVDDIAAFSDQQMRLCAVGILSSGKQIPYDQAASKTWYLDRVPTIVTLVDNDQTALETDGSNKTITLNSSLTKPYPVDVSYKLVGDSTYMIDHNLPATGVITIPENSTSATVAFQTIHNLNNNTSKLMQLNLVKSDNQSSVVGARYTTRYFIDDVDAGVRPTVSKVSVAGTTSCAILTDGKLRCWGANSYGQLGDGTTTTRLTPVTVDSGTAYSQVVTAGGTTCGITTAGALKCWGRNNVGQLGDNTIVDKLSPIVVDSGVQYAKIKIAVNTSVTVCGITTTGILKCWGYNNKGQVGDGTVADKWVPTVVNSGTSYSDMEIGVSYSCGLVASTGVLKCWGYNNTGQLGDTTLVDKLTPTVINSGTSYSKISLGSGTTCGIVVTTGVLKCWGNNTGGATGDNSTTNRSTPNVPDGTANYVDVNTKGNTTCGITTTGILKCWGLNANYQVGDGTAVNKLVPTVIDSGSTYSKVYPNPNNSGNSCGITSAGVLKCWGLNSSGQLGDGTLSTRGSPVVIDAGVTYSSLDHYNSTVCAITTTGILKCWGVNTSGALADGTTNLKMVPTVADAGTTFKEIHTFGAITCGITTSDTIRCWGRGNSGQLGNGATQSNYAPVDVDKDTKYAKFRMFNDTMCGITQAGVLKCWGYNGYGQVGDGTTTFRSTPVVIDAGTLYKHVEPNNNVTCGITVNDVLKCWGYNGTSQLGDGTTTNRSVPTIIDSGVTYARVIPTSSASCGITKTGVLKCWGQNSNGQVGDGTTANKSVPTIVDSGTTYSYVITSYLNTSCGITTAGVLKCWGVAGNGQLGDGTYVQKTVPTVIDSGTTYSYVGESFNNTCGVTTAGVLKCWGLGGNGTLGDGTTVTKNVPTTIDSGTAYTNSIIVVYNGCAVTVAGALKCWGANNNGQVGDGTTVTKLSPILIDSGTSYKQLSNFGFGTTCGLTTTGIAKCWGNNSFGQVGDSPDDIVPYLPRNVMKWVVP